MLTTIQNYICTHRLLEENKPVLVGLSGGADSVALLAVLVRLGYGCVVAHCNFHLRGDESNRDESFAKGVARQFEIPFYKKDFDTEQYAREKGLSVEMAARELRYQWFEELRQEFNYQAVAVAHHRDDSVETLLMNLVRGTGIRGLSGIRPKNGYVVRPLLSVSREQLEDWLEEQNLSFVTDSTNLTDVYTRNFIRLNVLPLLEKINPSVKMAIARTSENLLAAESIYLHVIEEAKKKLIDSDCRISITALMQYPAPATILYELLLPYNFTRLVVRNIFFALNKEPGKEFYSITHRLIKDRDFLLITSLVQGKEKSYEISVQDKMISLPVELTLQKSVITTEFLIEKDKSIGYFDFDKLRFPLKLRKWEVGDWFVPFGMKGRKKLSDYFTDRKFSKIQKEEIWLLCSGNEIIWVVGERTDERFRIDSQTKHALIVKKNN